MTETGLLLDQLRVRAGVAVAREIRKSGANGTCLVDLVKGLGPLAAGYEPLALATIASFRRALNEGVEPERALAYLLAGALDGISGIAKVNGDARVRYVVETHAPGTLSSFDTTTTEGKEQFDELLAVLAPDMAIATAGRVAPAAAGSAISAAL